MSILRNGRVAMSYGFKGHSFRIFSYSVTPSHLRFDIKERIGAWVIGESFQHHSYCISVWGAHTLLQIDAGNNNLN